MWTFLKRFFGGNKQPEGTQTKEASNMGDAVQTPVASNAADRLKLGMQLAMSLAAAVPGVTPDQIQGAATAALDVLMPAT